MWTAARWVPQISWCGLRWRGWGFPADSSRWGGRWSCQMVCSFFAWRLTHGPSLVAGNIRSPAKFYADRSTVGWLRQSREWDRLAMADCTWEWYELRRCCAPDSTNCTFQVGRGALVLTDCWSLVDAFFNVWHFKILFYYQRWDCRNWSIQWRFHRPHLTKSNSAHRRQSLNKCPQFGAERCYNCILTGFMPPRLWNPQH